MIKNRGVTLIENVIAIILLGILITAMVYSFASARMYGASARHRQYAINRARDRVEEIIRAGVAKDVTASPSNVTISGLTDGVMSITYVPLPTTDEVCVTVKVSWTEKMWTDKTNRETIVIYLNTI